MASTIGQIPGRILNTLMLDEVGVEMAIELTAKSAEWSAEVDKLGREIMQRRQQIDQKFSSQYTKLWAALMDRYGLQDGPDGEWRIDSTYLNNHGIGLMYKLEVNEQSELSAMTERQRIGAEEPGVNN